MSDTNYSTDKPIQGPDDDAFGRAGFAERLASTIANKELYDGYVMGLYSEWGYGKTSVLNMVTKELSKKEGVEVTKFNPWMYTDQQAMIRSLFDTIATAIDAQITTGAEKVGDALRKYAKVFSLVKLDDLADATGEFLTDASLTEIRERVENALIKSNKQLVVIIDDVDRLDKDEIFQLFKLIKIAVDFKRVVYVVAMDDGVVSKALAERYMGSDVSGQSFLEKIIQVPINLPLIDQPSLNDFTLSRLNGILESYGIEVSDDEAEGFKEAFGNYIARGLNTPRMAIRYLNALKFVLPLTMGETNPVDVLIIEAFRLIDPEAYKKTRVMKDDLTGSSKKFSLDEQATNQAIKERVNAVADGNPEQLWLLRFLFPSVNAAYQERAQQHIDELGLQANKRIASPDYFDRYFTYNVPKGDMPDLAIVDLITETSPTEVAFKLKRLLKDYDMRAVLKKLRAYEERITDGKNLAIALALQANGIPDQMTGIFTDSDLEISAKLLVVMIKNLKDGKLDLAKQIVASSTSLYQVAHFVKWIDIESSDKKETRIFDDPELAEFHKAVAARLAKEKVMKLMTSSSGYLVTFLLGIWAEAEDVDTVSAELSKQIKTFDDVCTFLTAHVGIWHGHGKPRRGNFDMNCYKLMCNAIHPDFLYKLLVAHDRKYESQSKFPQFGVDDNILGEESKQVFKDVVAKQFIYCYQNPEDAPKDQSVPLPPSPTPAQ